jgi:signal transduction histidine kinase
MTHAGKVVGCLSVDIIRCVKTWTQDDINVLKLVGELIAISRARHKAEEALRQSEAREREKAKELELTLGELKRTQANLIQTEKMSSLGRLVAGVAHEINNPISFIGGNLTYARRYFQDLLELVQLYQATYPNPTQEIQQRFSQIDLNFLVQDWSKLMNSMQVGAKRIQEIVLSLRNFSRLDENDLKSVDIHQGIDNTLLILQHRLKAEGRRAEIQVIKDYDPLPKVTCYASQLNQVFMNLLNNAIDAVETQPHSRVITIHTLLIQNYHQTLIELPWANIIYNHPVQTPNPQSVVILVTDNGPGMSKEILHKIFDPFFTTKPVGSGTGLGLSISYQIVVEKHRGQLSCISAPGYGTAFIVDIPVNLTPLSSNPN